MLLVYRLLERGIRDANFLIFVANINLSTGVHLQSVLCALAGQPDEPSMFVVICSGDRESFPDSGRVFTDWWSLHMFILDLSTQQDRSMEGARQGHQDLPYVGNGTCYVQWRAVHAGFTSQSLSIQLQACGLSL